jgi:ArsR family transcriptional regulator
MIISGILDLVGATMETVYEKNAKVFKAFCDEKRLRILELLQSGEKCTCKLIEDMDMPQSTLSYHMKVLCESGVVEGRQDGKWTHYRISEKGSLWAAELLKELTASMPSHENSDACCLK